MFEFLLSRKVLEARLLMHGVKINGGPTTREKAEQKRLSAELKRRKERELGAWRRLHRAS